MTGENLYALRQEKQRWIAEFEKKYGSDAIARLEGKNTSIRALLDEVGVMPFLAERRLVILEGVPKATKEEIQALETAIHPMTVLLVVDSSPDKRLAGVKHLLAIATTKTFAPMRGAALKQWLQSEAARLGFTFGPGARELLCDMIGEEQEALGTELEKLSLAITGGVLTVADIERLTLPTDEGVVWTMTDLISSGKRREAMQYARRLLARGSDAYGLWAILLSMLKNVVLVRAALDDGLKQAKDIAERTGVHPFALRSIQPYATRCALTSLTAAVAWTADADVRLKTGGYRSTDEFPQELHALIDRFLLTLPTGR